METCFVSARSFCGLVCLFGFCLFLFSFLFFAFVQFGLGWVSVVCSVVWFFKKSLVVNQECLHF